MKDKRKLLTDKVVLAKAKGVKLLDDKNLKGWNVVIDSKLDCIAETRHQEKTIAFNKKFIKVASKDEFEGVVLHEITHSLLGPGKGHGHEFKRLCKKISNNNEYAKKQVHLPLTKYIATCPRCNHTGACENKDKIYCAKCLRDGEIVKFNTKVNPLNLVEW